MVETTNRVTADRREMEGEIQHAQGYLEAVERIEDAVTQPPAVRALEASGAIHKYVNVEVPRVAVPSKTIAGHSFNRRGSLDRVAPWTSGT